MAHHKVYYRTYAKEDLPTEEKKEKDNPRIPCSLTERLGETCPRAASLKEAQSSLGVTYGAAGTPPDTRRVRPCCAPGGALALGPLLRAETARNFSEERFFSGGLKKSCSHSGYAESHASSRVRRASPYLQNSSRVGSRVREARWPSVAFFVPGE